MGQINDRLKHLICAPIKFYQYMISPTFPASCRFYPSCSDYAIQAVTQHGILRGFVLACSRLCRCHPYSLGGFDPIPEKREKY